jgi:transcriptional regulator with XRE-family HTH domain
MNLDEQNFLRELGLRVRGHRERYDWTQEEMGLRCGLHRTFIGSVERGERNISILNLRMIARILRVPLEMLLAESPRLESDASDR